MAVYEVFTQPVCYRYKSTICSKATVVLVLITVLTTLLPFIISYRSNGFWLKTATFQEQPQITFSNNYLLVLETELSYRPVFCATQYGINQRFQRHCTFKSREDDLNRDGKVDMLHVDVSVPLQRNESVYSLTLLLPLSLHLENICQLQMQTLAVVQYSAAQPGASFGSAADLRFVQRKPLRYKTIEDIQHTFSLSGDTNMGKLLLEYAQWNFSTSLVNRYDVWSTGRSPDAPFLLSLVISFPENTIIYHPGFWQVMKWAWMQYFSVLIVFIYFFRILKEYIFHNQLISTCRVMPNKKGKGLFL